MKLLFVNLLLFTDDHHEEDCLGSAEILQSAKDIYKQGIKGRHDNKSARSAKRCRKMS